MAKPSPYRLLLPAFVIAATFLIHAPLILTDPLLARDDLHILSRLKSWDMIMGMFREGRFGWMIAFQPVSELTLRANLMLRESLGWGGFHLVNALLWLAIVASANSLAKELLDSDFRRDPRRTAQIRVATALFAIHPVFAGSVAWVSARKHLLSCLFALIASVLWVRIVHGRGRGLKNGTSMLASVPTLYVLSALSHPINVLWPVWAAFHAWQNRDRGILLRREWMIGLVPCFALMVVAGAANLAYYLSDYVTHTTQTKVIPITGTSVSVSLLALGRYATNFVFPFKTAAVYYPGSALNAVGLVLFTALGLLAYFLRDRIFRSAFALFLCALAPVTMLATNVFVSDTYALSAGVGALAMGLVLYDHIRARLWPDKTLFAIGAFAVAAILAFGFRSREIAGAWASDRALWEHTVRTEESPRALAALSRILLNTDPPELEQARTLVDRLSRWNPNDPDLPYLYARSVYSDPELTPRQKADLLAGATTAWGRYYLAASLAQLGLFKESFAPIAEAVSSAARDFGGELPQVVAEFVYLCRKSGKADECESIAATARSQNPDIWNDAAFLRRLAELGQS